MRRYYFPKPYADLVARLRVPSGFLLVAAFGWFAAPSAESLLWGLPVGGLGLLLRGWAAGHLEKNQRVVSSGPYGHTRNPLYLGTYTVALGLALAARRWELAALFTAVFLLVYLPVMELEEQHLRGLFAGYSEYADRVPLLAPRLGGASGPGAFRWAIYLKNEEYNAAIGFAIGYAFLAWRALGA